MRDESEYQPFRSDDLMESKAFESIMNDFQVDYKELTISKVVGSGNFGIVYLAQFRNERVAAKQLHPKGMNAEDLKVTIRDFLSEAKVRKFLFLNCFFKKLVSS